jgi:hypothetical protein
VLIISAIIFGLLMLIIHNKFEDHIASEKSSRGLKYGKDNN